MSYILVKPEILKKNGIERFETIPDGRAIAQLNVLKVLGSVSNIEVVSTARELEMIIDEQKKSKKWQNKNE